MEEEFDIHPKEISQEPPLPQEEESSSPKMEEEPASQEETPQTLGEVPLTLAVELARIQIPLEKLMQLQPGNTLEMPLDPTQLVSLTLRGKLIAKGELIQLGEKLGIQITTLGPLA
ncbi:MAG: FliM/FliN family flagellar motor switch protein [Chlamydiia bacterium]|nr:FliM/FliN family flagellar motor switch protein [Chlamydiia bacterium]